MMTLRAEGKAEITPTGRADKGLGSDPGRQLQTAASPGPKDPF